MSYIETMLAAIPAENKDAYYQSAEKMAALFLKLGLFVWLKAGAVMCQRVN